MGGQVCVGVGKLLHFSVSFTHTHDQALKMRNRATARGRALDSNDKEYFDSYSWVGIHEVPIAAAACLLSPT